MSERKERRARVRPLLQQRSSRCLPLPVSNKSRGRRQRLNGQHHERPVHSAVAPSSIQRCMWLAGSTRQGRWRACRRTSCRPSGGTRRPPPRVSSRHALGRPLVLPGQAQCGGVGATEWTCSTCPRGCNDWDVVTTAVSASKPGSGSAPQFALERLRGTKEVLAAVRNDGYAPSSPGASRRRGLLPGRPRQQRLRDALRVGLPGTTRSGQAGGGGQRLQLQVRRRNLQDDRHGLLACQGAAYACSTEAGTCAGTRKPARPLRRAEAQPSSTRPAGRAATLAALQGRRGPRRREIAPGRRGLRSVEGRLLRWRGAAGVCIEKRNLKRVGGRSSSRRRRARGVVDGSSAEPGGEESAPPGGGDSRL